MKCELSTRPSSFLLFFLPLSLSLSSTARADEDLFDIVPGDVMSVIKIGSEVTNFIYGLWGDFAPDQGNGVESYPGLNFGRDRKVLKKFQQVTERLDALDVTLLGVQEALRSLHDVTPATVRWESSFGSLQVSPLLPMFIFCF